MTDGPLELIEGETFTHDAALAPGELARRLSGRELYKCTLRGLKLAEARLERTIFEACTFDDCDLTRAALPGVSLRGVTFRETKLLGVDFSKANDNPEVTFERCILRYARFDGMNLRGVRFSACELQEAQLVACSLVDADFAGSDLAGATIARCDLAGADFSAAAHVYLDPRDPASRGALVPVETAVLMAQALGLRVAGYEDAARGKGRGRRR